VQRAVSLRFWRTDPSGSEGGFQMRQLHRFSLRSIALSLVLSFAALATWATGSAQSAPVAASSLVAPVATPALKDVTPVYYYRRYYYHRRYYRPYYHHYYYRPHYYHPYYYHRPYYHRYYYYHRPYYRRHFYHRYYY
jgi:hypothetical protein